MDFIKNFFLGGLYSIQLDYNLNMTKYLFRETK